MNGDNNNDKVMNDFGFGHQTVSGIRPDSIDK